MAFKYIQNEDKSLTVDDPIYGQIVVPYPFSQLILTKEMKRLSEIGQNGFAQLEYKKLSENERLSHSVGAFYIMTLFINRLDEILKKFNVHISDDDKEIALCSILLHDIGHGPFSHSLELITNYSHEKRTTDILLGNTEINNVITAFFGKEKVKKVANFITKINNDKDLSNNEFTKLLNNLISYQLDADRIDYLIRDTHYLDIYSAIDLKKLIANIDVVINNNKEYELIIDKKGLSIIENILIQRYQMYRDIYLGQTSVLGDTIFQKIIERFRNSTDLHSLPVSESFKSLISDPQVSDLNMFIKMKDDDFKYSFKVLSTTIIDPVMAYLANFDNIEDYLLINNNISIKKIKSRLKGIFGNIDLDNTLSIFSINRKSNLYKKDQRLNIKNGNRIMDLTECTNLIREQDILENKYTFFNPELLRIELGLSTEEFIKYKDDLNKMINELNKKPEEFELKYIITDDSLDQNLLIQEIISLFLANGFKIISTDQNENNDQYYDTKNLDLYINGESLRIRKTKQKDKTKVKATFKSPLEKGEVYSSRNEFEETLPNDSFETFKQAMIELDIGLDFNEILKFPILNCLTKRIDIILEKNGIQVCLSVDNCQYTNYLLDKISARDSMIEIEAIGELNNRIILNEIHDFITSSVNNLVINKQSKYERAINKTFNLNKCIEQIQSIPSQTDLSNNTVLTNKSLVKKLITNYPQVIE